MSLMHTGRPWRGSPRPQGTPRTSGTPRTRTQICELILASVTCCIALLYWENCLPLWIMCWIKLTSMYFRLLWTWKARGSQIWNLCGWEEPILLWTVKNCVVEDVISVVVRLQPAFLNSIDYCKLALCKRIPFFIVVGPTWPTRPTWSARSSWSLYSRHRIEFGGIRTTRKGRGARSTCKCQCVCLSAPLAK